MTMPRRSFLTRLAAAAPALACSRHAAPEPENKLTAAPPFPIVDTHVHFWDPARLEYGWIKGNPILNRAYLPNDYLEQTKDVEVQRIVFVQAACRRDQAWDEVLWVSKLAESEPRIQAIVADAPLEQGAEAAPFLEKLAEHPLARGVRCMLQGYEDPAFCLRPEFVKGVQLLERHQLTFDFGVRTDQLPACAELAGRCPGVRFMLDHLGAPTLKGEAFDTWKRDLERLAGQPNVCCKMSGLATRAEHTQWTPADLAPAIRHALDCFGFRRTAFGSDWPVMLLATPFPRWVGVLRKTVRASEADLRQLFVETGTAFYRLSANT